MWKRNPREKIYVSLDAIMDTELGIVLTKVQSKKKKIRYLNDFKKTNVKWPAVQLGMFDKEEFEELWFNRDKWALANAGMTGIISEVKALLDAHANRGIADPYTKHLKLVIDTYPYELVRSEREVVASGITCHIGFDTEIEFIYKSELELGPTELMEYEHVFIKDHENWIKYHLKGVSKNPALLETKIYMPGTTTGVPLESLAEDPLMNKELLAGNNPHELTAMIISQYIDCTMIKADLYKSV